MNTTEFIVAGKIKGKSRPRFNTKTGRAYKVKQDRDYEKLIQDAYRSSGGVKSDKYIHMTLEMYFAVPKSYTKKRRNACLEGTERPAKKPDADNIIKNVCDSLNEVAFNDDVQVIEIECKKFYTESEEDYIKIKLKELN